MRDKYNMNLILEDYSLLRTTINEIGLIEKITNDEFIDFQKQMDQSKIKSIHTDQGYLTAVQLMLDNKTINICFNFLIKELQYREENNYILEQDDLMRLSNQFKDKIKSVA